MEVNHPPIPGPTHQLTMLRALALEINPVEGSSQGLKELQRTTEEQSEHIRHLQARVDQMLYQIADKDREINNLST